MSELDDLLGVPDPDQTVTSPRRAARLARAQAALAGETAFDPMTLEHSFKGWSATQFSKVLRMDLAEVKRRLAGVTPMSGAKNAAKYDIKTAMPHLVNPVVNVEDYIKNMDPKHLPTQMTEAFWRGEEKRLKTLELAGQLWATDKVLAGYAIIFKNLRDQMNLWLDTIDESDQMTDIQRRTAAQLITALQEEIMKDLRKYASENTTRSELSFLEDRLNAIRTD